MTQANGVLENEWLSQSRASDWRCPYRYELIHVKKLVRRWTPAPMKRGTLVHAGMQFALWWAHVERLWNEGLGPANVTGQMVEHTGTALEWGEAAIRNAQAVWLASEAVAPFVTDDMRQGAELQVTEAIGIFHRAWKFLDVGNKWETVCLPDGTPLIEHKMRAPHLIPGGWAGAQGTLDWVARDLATGHIWLFDFKTSKALQGDDYHTVQFQAPLYQFLLMCEGLELVGTATLQVRAAVPKVPKLNKNGTMSRAACATDPPTYIAALRDNGLEPSDYLDFICDLKPFDKISTEFRSYEHVERIVADFQAIGKSISLAHEHGLFPRNANPFSCRGCLHRSYCEADLNGEDLEFLAETEYMREGEIPYAFTVEVDDDGDD